MMDKEAMEETLEVLGEVADGCKAMARAFKGAPQPKAPVINNRIEVPKQSVPVVNNQINVPTQPASPPPVINILPSMWAGEIKVHRHPNGLVSHYELKPKQP
jgi:hypothetical protein